MTTYNRGAAPSDMKVEGSGRSVLPKVLLVSVLSPIKENQDGVTKINYQLTYGAGEDSVDWISLESVGAVVKKSKLKWLVSVAPFNVISRENLARLSSKVNELSSQYDVIHVSSIELAELCFMLTEQEKVLFSAIDCHAMLFRRRCVAEGSLFAKIVWWIESFRARLYERKLYSSGIKVHFVSSVDANYAKLIAPNIDAVVVGNGVDTEKFYPRELPKRYPLVFVGNMGYGPNRQAANFLVEKVMPILQKNNPEISLYLVGRGLEGNFGSNVITLGYVPDLGRLLGESELFVAPIFFAAGVQNKILEALACGLPVLTTPYCMEGIEYDGVLVTQLDSTDPNVWVRNILSNLRESNERKQRLIDFQGLSWESVRDSYKKIWLGISDKRFADKAVKSKEI